MRGTYFCMTEDAMPFDAPMPEFRLRRRGAALTLRQRSISRRAARRLLRPENIVHQTMKHQQRERAEGFQHNHPHDGSQSIDGCGDRSNARRLRERAVAGAGAAARAPRRRAARRAGAAPQTGAAERRARRASARAGSP